jgi:hypothetical protein
VQCRPEYGRTNLHYFGINLYQQITIKSHVRACKDILQVTMPDPLVNSGQRLPPTVCRARVDLTWLGNTVQFLFQLPNISAQFCLTRHGPNIWIFSPSFLGSVKVSTRNLTGSCFMGYPWTPSSIARAYHTLSLHAQWASAPETAHRPFQG